MCGIAGQFHFEGSPDKDLVYRMTETMIHRGPDGRGFYFGGNIGLGMRRLKIIDLLTGDQPIHNSRKDVWVIFNGEIYNYQPLRESLKKKGYSFYTQSDTEVIIHLYDEYGEEFANHLEGMFAIALWDEREEKLILARDRSGEKPLYYYSGSNYFLFASELKAILECRSIKKEIDFNSLHHFFLYGRVPAPFSIIKGIRKVEPASLVVVRDGEVKVRRYWRVSFKDKILLPEESIKGELLGVFERSVKSRMVADVPLGAMLSGGIDSSAVVAMMARNSERPIETFSIGFQEKDFSELSYARLIAKQFGTNHHEFIVEPKVLEVVPRLVWHLDEPFGDFSVIPMFYISQAARPHITVALTGDGGDELFAGYEWFKAIKIAQKYNKLPKIFRKFLASLSKIIPDSQDRESLVRYLHKLKRLAETQAETSLDPLEILLSINSGFTEKLLKESLYGKTMLENTRNIDGMKLRRMEIGEYDGGDPLEALLYSQFRALLPDMFFTKVDRASMAVSLETRAPFVSREMIEFSAKIPFSYKLKGFETKYILKRALEDILPQKILYRHKKGFTLPLGRWMRESSLSKNIKETLLDKSFRDLNLFKIEFWILG
ncbi:MAG: asparagine synthase (glutamine-hydrolysing) [Parcubacteria group bacterium Gr01-1014_107]|nr:MAG: asparagine synthase (glutamine-hydrolysing) [Parcubacteria group bacterium Gr01-1014_107]